MKDPIAQFMNNTCTKVEFIAKGRPGALSNSEVVQQDIIKLTNEITDATYSYGISYARDIPLDHLVGKSFEQCKQYLEQVERQAYDIFVKNKVRTSRVTFGTYISSGRSND